MKNKMERHTHTERERERERSHVVTRWPRVSNKTIEGRGWGGEGVVVGEVGQLTEHCQNVIYIVYTDTEKSD